MKKPLLALLLAFSVLISACSSETVETEDLEGRFTITPIVTLKLSPSSPAGSRSVSTSDDILMVEMSSSSKQILPKGTTFKVSLTTDLGDIDTTTSPSVLLTADGTKVGAGTFNVTSANSAEAVITLNDPLILSTAPVTFTVTTDTTALIAEDTGEDDHATFAFIYDSKSVKGNDINY
jgi:hypothetical protein